MRTIGGVFAERPALNPSGKTTQAESDDTPHESSMPIHMGIACERCGSVHFIATSSAIKFRRRSGIYQLNCPPPCCGTREFSTDEMCTYRVSDEAFRRGYALESEYEFVPSTERRMLRYLSAPN